MYLWLCYRDSSPLSTFILLFLLQDWVPHTEVLQHLDREVVTALHMHGILTRKEGKLASNLSLYPCCGALFFTDLWINFGPQQLGHVYEIGVDSYLLSRSCFRTSPKKTLDLCTGSGIHAILSSLKGAHSKAVDINPRALLFTEMNSALNNTEVTVSKGDLYDGLGDELFDLITANPPFVPSPEPEMLIHRSPGESGEEVSQQLVQGLPRFLAPGGRFTMILNYPDIEGDPYVQRLERWLGEQHGWLIAVVDYAEIGIGQYIRTHMNFNENYLLEFARYLESYAAQKFRALYLATVYIVRTGDKRPNRAFRIKVDPPTSPVHQRSKRWLEAKLHATRPDWSAPEEWVPKLNPDIKELWTSSTGDRGLVQCHPGSWAQERELPQQEIDLLVQVDGKTPVRALKQRSSVPEEQLLSYLQGFQEESFLL